MIYTFFSVFILGIRIDLAEIVPCQAAPDPFVMGIQPYVPGMSGNACDAFALAFWIRGIVNDLCVCIGIIALYAQPISYLVRGFEFQSIGACLPNIVADLCGTLCSVIDQILDIVPIPGQRKPDLLIKKVLLHA